ncbi:LysM peptidoglycan-binding domain-containing protein [Paenibacillus tepidiphilus]|uniref:LysM peptidoglycan-binding domain-containing protein n=1 Tax=Paenibacillus tepidiphilus TaxID=2608683 RepID=UPI00123A5501|nr:LysM domain-containing protein [Paenibacillus tepidiphilus]
MTEEYGFFLSFNNAEEVIRLPVNPEILEIKESGDGKSYTVIDLGEINAIAYPKLTEITIESMFPSQWYPFVVAGNTPTDKLLRPFDYVELIKKWMNSRRPVRFVFTGLKADADTAAKSEQEPGWLNLARQKAAQSVAGDFGINMAVSIENFAWKLSAGNTGDIEYTLGLKKYVFYQAAPVKVVGGEAKPQQKRDSDKKAAATYTLKAGDTLWRVALKELGDGSKYKTLQKLNGIPDSELNRLQIGRVIKLS